MTEGLRAPDFLKRELTQSDFPNQRRESLKQWLTPDPENPEGPPPTLVAVMKDITKKYCSARYHGQRKATPH